MQNELKEALSDILCAQPDSEQVLTFLLDLLTHLEQTHGSLVVEPAQDGSSPYIALARKLTSMLCRDSGAGVHRLYNQLLDVITSVFLTESCQDQDEEQRLRRLMDWLTMLDIYQERTSEEFEQAQRRYFEDAVLSMRDLLVTTDREAAVREAREAAQQAAQAEAQATEQVLLERARADAAALALEEARRRNAELEAQLALAQQRLTVFFGT